MGSRDTCINTVTANTSEFVSAETEAGVRTLYAIDAYQQLRDGVHYPGAMISTGLFDRRISPWMPAKYAARLQVTTASKHPVLLRVDDLGGHGGGTREQAEAELADTYSFILWQAGVPEFQPR